MYYNNLLLYYFAFFFQPRDVAAAVQVPFISVWRSMLRWRQSSAPNIPRGLPDLGNLLCSGDWPRFSTSNSGQFYSGSVEADGSHALIFGSIDFITNFTDSQHIFVDGTFKVVPRRPGFNQLLTVFGTCMDHVSFFFPILT